MGVVEVLQDIIHTQVTVIKVIPTLYMQEQVVVQGQVILNIISRYPQTHIML